MKIEQIIWNVEDLNEAVELFSDLFDTEFVNTTEIIEKNNIKVNKTVIKENESPNTIAKEVRFAASPVGIELFQTIPPPEKEGLRSVAFRVDDIEEAKERFQKKGIRMVSHEEIGGFKGVIFSADDLHGMRVILCEYHDVSDYHYWLAYLQEQMK